MEEKTDSIQEFTDSCGNKLCREEAEHTKYGLVILQLKNGFWFVTFPDWTKAKVSTIELINLIYFLKETNGNLDKSRQWVGIK